MGEEQNKSSFENEQELPEDTAAGESASEVYSENDAAETESADSETEAAEITETEESESEESGEAVTAETENQAEEGSENQSLASVNEEAQESVQENTQAKAGKKRILYPSTIVVLVLVVASIVFYAVYASFFQTSVKGVWLSTEVEEASTANSYLVLTDDNIAYMAFGTMRYMGSYSTDYDDDGQKILTVNIPYALQSNFIYDVQGDILTLTVDGDSTSYTFKNVELPDYTLTVPDDYVQDDNILGKWKDYNYDIEYTFNSDGTMLINEAGLVEADCIYTVEDGTIHVEYLAGEIYTMDMEYAADGNNLTIGVMNFQKIADENGKAVPTEASTEATAEESTEATAETTAAA